MAYQDEPSFNAYLKDNNSCVDVEYKIEANYSEYLNVLSKADEMLYEDSKSSIFNILQTMANTGFFKNSDVSICRFDSLIFNLIYITSDRKRIPFHFKLKYNDILNISNRLNKDEAFLYLKFLGKY